MIGEVGAAVAPCNFCSSSDVW